MLLRSLTLALCAVAAAHAQPFRLALTVGQGASREATSHQSPVGYSEQVDLGKATLPHTGLWGSWRMVGLGPLGLDLTAGYQTLESKPVDWKAQWSATTVPPTAGAYGSQADLKGRQLMVGAQISGKTLADWGLGLEMRHERLDLVPRSIVPPPGAQVYDLPRISATQDRLWFRAQVGWSLPSPVLKPFLALSWAMALSSEAPHTASRPNEALVKGMAPKQELSLLAGISF